MDRDQLLSSLDDIEASMSAEFGDSQPDRVAQLSSHIATCKMVVEHMFDAAENGAAEEASA